MNLSKEFPESRPQSIDFFDLRTCQGQLYELSDAILALTADVAKARTAVEYDGDRRKRILARYMRPHFKAKRSASESEQLARADEDCEKELDQCRADYETAQAVLEHSRALHVKWESLRSINSGLNKAAGI